MRRWREAVEEERKRSLIRARAEAMHTRRAVIGLKRECYDEWLVVAVRAAGWREKSYAAMNEAHASKDAGRVQRVARRRRLRRPRVRHLAFAGEGGTRATGFPRRFGLVSGLAPGDIGGGFLAVLRGVDGASGATFARDSASRRLRRVVRMWYAIAGAGVAHPERRRAHDVAIAAHRRSSNLKTTARAFAALRVAVVKRAVTAVTADATRVKCAAVAGWRARRVTREVFWALVRAAERGARFRDALAAVARDRLVASGKTFLRRWRSVARDATEARRADDVLETMRARSERRDAWRRLATWRRAVYASRTLTNREARADRFYSRRLRAQYLARSLSAWIRFARARTARRVVNERALVSAARLRARIERSTTRGVFEAWLGVTKALRRLAYDVAAFAEDRNARTLTDVLATWRWRAAASTEARVSSR